MAASIREIANNLITVDFMQYIPPISSARSKTSPDEKKMPYEQITALSEFQAATSLSEQDAIIRRNHQLSGINQFEVETISEGDEKPSLEKGNREAMTQIDRLRAEMKKDWENYVDQLDLKAKSGVIVDFSTY